MSESADIAPPLVAFVAPVVVRFTCDATGDGRGVYVLDADASSVGESVSAHEDAPNDFDFAVVGFGRGSVPTMVEAASVSLVDVCRGGAIVTGAVLCVGIGASSMKTWPSFEEPVEADVEAIGRDLRARSGDDRRAIHVLPDFSMSAAAPPDVLDKVPSVHTSNSMARPWKCARSPYSGLVLSYISNRRTLKGAKQAIRDVDVHSNHQQHVLTVDLSSLQVPALTRTHVRSLVCVSTYHRPTLASHHSITSSVQHTLQGHILYRDNARDIVGIRLVLLSTNLESFGTTTWNRKVLVQVATATLFAYKPKMDNLLTAHPSSGSR